MQLWAMLLLSTNPSGAYSVGDFVRETLNVTSYKQARADLNGDGRPEILVYALDRGWCGSGGCTLFVLTPSANFYRLLSRTTITRPPIWLLPGKTKGWHDLGVTVGGGGIRPHMVRLRFDGRGYPLNPTVPPARPIDSPRGKVLIAN